MVFTQASHHRSAAAIRASSPVHAEQDTAVLHTSSKKSIEVAGAAAAVESIRNPKIPMVSLPEEEFPVVVDIIAVVVTVVVAIVVVGAFVLLGLTNVGGTQLASGKGGVNDHIDTALPLSGSHKFFV